jgi:tetratricopeptide (TPR) repeat protein
VLRRVTARVRLRSVACSRFPSGRVLAAWLAVRTSARFSWWSAVVLLGVSISVVSAQSDDGQVSAPRPSPPSAEDLPAGAACQAFTLPADFMPVCSQISAALSARRLEEARRLANELNAGYPGNGAGPFWLGQVDVKEGSFFSAIRHFEDAVDRTPGVALAHLDLGLAYLLIEQYKLFRDQMQWLIQHRPRQALPHYYLGRFSAKNLDDPALRMPFFRKALELDPTNYRSHYELGYLLEVQGDSQQAITEYEAALAGAESQKVAYAWPLQGLARIYLRQNAPDRALAYALRAKAADPRLASNRLVLGKIYMQLGDAEKATEELKAAADLDPSDAGAQYQLFRAYSKVGKTADASRAHALFLRLRAAYGSE